MAKRKPKVERTRRFGFTTSEGDLILPLGSGAAALIFLKKFMPAKCCDGRVVSMVVNRDGKTRCTVCDGKYEDQEKASAEARG